MNDISQSKYVYTDVDLANITWNRHETRFDVVYDNESTAVLRVLHHNKPIIALKFNDISASRLQSLRHRWGQAYGSVYGLSVAPKGVRSVIERFDWHNLVSVTDVEIIDTTQLWERQTHWSEDGFWAEPGIRLCISQWRETGSKISVLEAGGSLIGYFHFLDYDVNSEEIKALAIILRDSLHLKKPIRVEVNSRNAYYILADNYNKE